MAQVGYLLDSGSPRSVERCGARGRPPGRPASRRTRASVAVQGDRPTKPMPERLPESSRYPTSAIRRGRNRGHHGRGPVSVGGSAWAFDCHLSRPEARRDLRGGRLEGYATAPTLAAGDIVIKSGGRSTLTGQPTMPTTRGFALSCCTACLIFGQAAPQKQLTARELFYAAAQAPASQTGNARPPAKRSTRTPAKPVEIARADPNSPATRSAEPPAAQPASPPAATAPAPLKYSVRQAAAALNVSTTYAYRMITLGRLGAVLDGERRFITSAELRRYVESLPTVPVAPRPKPRSVGRPRRAVEAIA